MLANKTPRCNRNLSSLTLKLVDGDEYILLGICLTVNPDPLVDELHVDFHYFDCSHEYHFSQVLLNVHRKWCKFYIYFTILCFFWSFLLLIEPDVSAAWFHMFHMLRVKVFWDVTPCHWANGSWRSAWPLKMDAPWSLKCQEPFTHKHSVTLQKT